MSPIPTVTKSNMKKILFVIANFPNLISGLRRRNLLKRGIPTSTSSTSNNSESFLQKLSLVAARLNPEANPEAALIHRAGDPLSTVDAGGPVQGQGPPHRPPQRAPMAVNPLSITHGRKSTTNFFLCYFFDFLRNKIVLWLLSTMCLSTSLFNTHTDAPVLVFSFALM